MYTDELSLQQPVVFRLQQRFRSYKRKQVRQQDTNPPYGGTFPGGARDLLHFYKALVELMLSSNWHVTLRLAIRGQIAKI